MEHLVTQVAKRIQETYYGKYRGFVADNKDPEKRARLRLRIPSVLATGVTNWALPCLPFGGLKDQGLFMVPEVDTQVWVEFEEGNIHCPIWTGTFWRSKGDAPKEAVKDKPTTRLIKTPSGHLLQFDDEEGEEKILLSHKANATLEIDDKGTITLTDAKKSSITLDADAGEIVIKDANDNTVTMSDSGITVEDAEGNSIEMASAGITIKGEKIIIEGSSKVILGGEGGEEGVIKGSFLSMYASHTHPTALGPSGPPIPQGEMSTESKKVMTI